MSNSLTNEWQILTCGGCGTRMKAMSNLPDGSHVACPGCGGPVRCGRALPSPQEIFSAPLQTGPAHAPSATAWDGAEVRGTSFQGPPIPATGQDTNSQGTLSDQDFRDKLAPSSDHSTGEHGRVKKRKMKARKGLRSDLADWDAPLERLPAAELIADTWEHPQPLPEEASAETSQRIVVDEVDREGNSVRKVKRVKKRRILGLAQIFFRRFSYSTRIVTILLALVILCTGCYFGVRVFMEKFTPQPPRDTREDFIISREFLSEQNSAGATETVRNFLAAATVEEKLKYVRTPEKTGPLMEAWYRAHPPVPMTAGDLEEQTKMKSGDHYFIVQQFPVTEPDPLAPGNVLTRTRYFTVEEILVGDQQVEYRLDWETAVNYQEMPLENFVSTRSRKAVAFRCKMRKADYWNHEFTDKTKWQSVELIYPGDDNFQFWAYLPLETGHGRRLSDIMESMAEGESISVVVKIRYPQNSISKSQVIVDGIVRLNWYDTGEQDMDRK